MAALVIGGGALPSCPPSPYASAARRRANARNPAIARLPYHDVHSPSIRIVGLAHRCASASASRWRNANGSVETRMRSRVMPCAIVVAKFRIALRRRCRHDIPARACQRGADIRLRGHGHPRRAPDEIEHAFAPATARHGVDRGQRAVEFAPQCRGLAWPLEDSAEERVQPRVVLGRGRVGDDHVRHERACRVDDFLAVLVHVHDEVRGCERAQALEIGILGAADLGHLFHHIARMDAESRARHHAPAQSQREQQLGEAGDEAGDARRGRR